MALFDLTPFATFELTGRGALAALQRLAANQMDCPVGTIAYTSMLTPRGGIKCDLTVTRLGEERFLVVTGGALGLHDLSWIEAHLPDNGSVNLTDISAAQCCIGLWGPRARDLISRVCEDDVSDAGFPYMTAKAGNDRANPRAGAAHLLRGRTRLGAIRRRSSTGRACGTSSGKRGQPHGLIAAGGGAFDSLRLEKGYRLWGPGHPHRVQPPTKRASVSPCAWTRATSSAAMR